MPPWNDSGKNLVRDLAIAMQRHHPHAMSVSGEIPGMPASILEAVYRHSSRFSMNRSEQARVLMRLACGTKHDLWHFFFAPNTRSSSASRLVRRWRNVPAIHTISSAPDPTANLGQVLFADRHVVLSKHTEQRLLAGGIPREQVVRIPPGIEPGRVPEVAVAERHRESLGFAAARPILLYPGDLEFSAGAERCLRALAQLPKTFDAHLVLACRAKTAEASEHERRLRALAKTLGVSHAVVWLGEVSNMHQLLSAVDLVILPSEHLYAKMDYPLVLLEAMALERPVIVAQGTAAAELAEHDGALAVEPDVDAIATMLGKLIDNVAARHALGKRGRKDVLERFNRTTMANSYEALYDTLL